MLHTTTTEVTSGSIKLLGALEASEDYSFPLHWHSIELRKSGGVLHMLPPRSVILKVCNLRNRWLHSIPYYCWMQGLTGPQVFISSCRRELVKKKPRWNHAARCGWRKLWRRFCFKDGIVRTRILTVFQNSLGAYPLSNLVHARRPLRRNLQKKNIPILPVWKLRTQYYGQLLNNVIIWSIGISCMI